MGPASLPPCPARRMLRPAVAVLAVMLLSAAPARLLSVSSPSPDVQALDEEVQQDTPLCPTMSTFFQCDLARCVRFQKYWQNGTCGQVCAEFAPTCLHRRFVCDGVPDCEDGSDEHNCVQCAVTAFPCDGQCRRKELRCDLYRHCKDGSDDRDCPSVLTPSVAVGSLVPVFACSDLSTIHRNSTCDGVRDCPDGEDEKSCRSPEDCHRGAFFCDGHCHRSSRRCDAVKHCADGSDEIACPANLRTVAVIDKRDPEQTVVVIPECFNCGNGRCIAHKYKCDGVDNCLNEKDEKKCFTRLCTDARGKNCVATKCSEEGIPCRKGYRCGRSKWTCDGFAHCDAGVDEKACYAPPDVFLCADGTSRPRDEWCDSKADCLNGEDESSCPSQPPPVFCRGGNQTQQQPGPGASQGVECPVVPAMITCKDGTTRLNSTRCDGVFDCPHGEDEDDCAGPGHCEDGALLCGGRCVMASKRCDGYMDCADGEDERGCLDYLPVASTFSHPRLCGPGRFDCGNKCVLQKHVCDGVRDCDNNADEANCLVCQGDAFLCNSRCQRRVHACHWEKEPCAELAGQGQSGSHEFWARQLPEASGYCDGVPDCSDGRDEKSCSGPLPSPCMECDSKLCSGFWCDSQCRPASIHCDANVDCDDRADEMDCPESLPNTTVKESWHRHGRSVEFTWTHTTTLTVNGTFTNVTTVLNDSVAIITTSIVPRPGKHITLYVDECPDEPRANRRGRKQRKRKRKQRKQLQQTERKRKQERKQTASA